MTRALIIVLSFTLQHACAQLAGSLAPGTETGNPELINFQLLEEGVLLSPDNDRLNQLAKFGLLSSKELLALKTHLQQYGPMLSKYELMAVRGLSTDGIKAILPYVTIAPNSTAHKLRLAHQLAFRIDYQIERRLGFSDTSDAMGFQGPRPGLLTRYHFDSPGLKGGFALQQDPGEPFKVAIPDQFLFDQSNFYLQVDRGAQKVFSGLLIGDYTFRLAQGLAFAGGFNIGSGIYPASHYSSATGAKPYRSRDESAFLRGFALDLRPGRATKRKQLSLFASIKRRNSNATDSTTTLSSSNGLHRTPVEIQRRRQVEEMLLGLVLRGDRGTLAYLAGVRYGKEILASPLPYRQFNFSGKQLGIAGIAQRFTVGPALLFGEMAFSIHERQSFAGVVGALIAPAPRTDLALVYRRFGISYFAPYAAPSVSTRTSNEEGLSIALAYRLSNSTTIHAAVNNGLSPWLRYRINRPTTDHTIRLRLDQKWSKTKRLSVSANARRSYRNDNGTVRRYIRQAWQLHYLQMLGRNIRWQNRFAVSSFKLGNDIQNGWLCYTDLRYRQMGESLTILGRLAVFEAQGWDSRLFAYENDLRGSFSIPAYYGQGVRFYILCQYNWHSTLLIESRFSVTKWFDREDYGTGADYVEGPTNTRWSLQVTWKRKP